LNADAHLHKLSPIASDVKTVSKFQRLNGDAASTNLIVQKPWRTNTNIELFRPWRREQSGLNHTRDADRWGPCHFCTSLTFMHPINISQL